jgi:hypothetical protein
MYNELREFDEEELWYLLQALKWYADTHPRLTPLDKKNLVKLREYIFKGEEAVTDEE